MMKTINWLKRKYPKSWSKILDTFEESDICKYLKERKYIPVILLEKHLYDHGKDYPKGTLCLIKVSKEYDESYLEDPVQYSGWTGEFVCYGLFKCIEKGLTASGYHSTYMGMNGSVKYKKLE